jgi:hypothetical protein
MPDADNDDPVQPRCGSNSHFLVLRKDVDEVPINACNTTESIAIEADNVIGNALLTGLIPDAPTVGLAKVPEEVPIHDCIPGESTGLQLLSHFDKVLPPENPDSLNVDALFNEDMEGNISGGLGERAIKEYVMLTLLRLEGHSLKQCVKML